MVPLVLDVGRRIDHVVACSLGVVFVVSLDDVAWLGVSS